MNINSTLYTLNTNIFNDNALYDDVYKILPQERREKIDRFRFEKEIDPEMKWDDLEGYIYG